MMSNFRMTAAHAISSIFGKGATQHLYIICLYDTTNFCNKPMNEGPIFFVALFVVSIVYHYLFIFIFLSFIAWFNLSFYVPGYLCVILYFFILQNRHETDQSYISH